MDDCHSAADRDVRLAAGLLPLLRRPADLAPIPLFGVPGWDARAQDEAFYRDVRLFRPLRDGASKFVEFVPGMSTAGEGLAWT